MEGIKTLRLILILIFLMSVFNDSSAQKVCKQVRNKEFIVDYDNKRVYDKSYLSDLSSQYEAYDPERFQVVNWEIVKESIKQSLSGERLKELSKEAFGLVINCKYDGEIQSINFIFPKDIFLTVEEIDNIDTNLRKKKFRIISKTVGNENGIQLGVPCRLRMLQN